MRCQCCGCHGPTKYVEFYQNIGALVMRFGKEMKANLCKPCINKYFWEMTLITLAVGWLGMISLILAPIFIILNIVNFVPTIGMPTPDKVYQASQSERANHPTLSLTPDVVAKLQPHGDTILRRLEYGEQLDRIAMDIAPKLGVSARQVELYAQSIDKSIE